ncbi:MAG: efflux RND transporter periplasmic adaptor subunit [Gemmatimonadales bacterium]|jgi:RND family efflux transporter MFP subunit
MKCPSCFTRSSRRWRIVAAGALAAAALTACDRSEPGRVPPAGEPLTVTTVPVTRSGASVEAPATVRSVERAELATRTSGRVLRVPVDAGSTVARGDVVLELDGQDVAARIRQAEAAAERARRSFARIESLHGDGAATDQELDDVRAQLAAAEAGLEEARAQRDYTVLRAPFAGTIVSRSVDPGDLAVPGRPVLSLAGAGALEVVADLPATLEGRVVAGDSLTVLHPESGARLVAVVARVAPAVDAAARRFRVEAALPAGSAGSPRLVPGTYVRLELPDPAGETLWVPAGAVVRRGQLAGVFTIDGDVARLRWIREGRRTDGAVEVLGGLTAGEVVVADPAPRLVDGQAVRAEAGTGVRP